MLVKRYAWVAFLLLCTFMLALQACSGGGGIPIDPCVAFPRPCVTPTPPPPPPGTPTPTPSASPTTTPSPTPSAPPTTPTPSATPPPPPPTTQPPAPTCPPIMEFGNTPLGSRDCGNCRRDGYLGYVLNRTATPLCDGRRSDCVCFDSNGNRRDRCELPKACQDGSGAYIWMTSATFSPPAPAAHICDERSDNKYNCHHKPRANETGIMTWQGCPPGKSPGSPGCGRVRYTDVQPGGARELDRWDPGTPFGSEPGPSPTAPPPPQATPASTPASCTSVQKVCVSGDGVVTPFARTECWTCSDWQGYMIRNGYFTAGDPKEDGDVGGMPGYWLNYDPQGVLVGVISKRNCTNAHGQLVVDYPRAEEREIPCPSAQPARLVSEEPAGRAPLYVAGGLLAALMAGLAVALRRK